MIEALDPRTLIKLRVIRRYSHYNVGEEIALDLLSAQDAYRKRLVDPLDLMWVPVLTAAAVDGPPASPPLRQPGAIVRK